MFVPDDDAQLHTLEGVAAALLLLGVIIYAMDATSLTPLTSSTSNAHEESELAVLGQDILNTLDYAEPGYSSKLKNDLLFWNGKEYLWDGTRYIENTNATYIQNNLSNNLTGLFISTLVKQGIAHRVEVTFLRKNGNETEPSKPRVMVSAGVPSNNAVIVSRKMVFHDVPDSYVIEPGNPIVDISPESNLRNIVDVRLILWRT
ncbi:MAG TPA: hypothetical protein VIO11_03705 [Candidatus Methanoperedens sp.]